MNFADGEQVLKRMRVPEIDFPQIKEAFHKTKYFTYDGNGRKKRISADSAFRLLGENEFWSGLSRSAFHWTAERGNQSDGTCVSFDSSALFR